MRVGLLCFAFITFFVFNNRSVLGNTCKNFESTHIEFNSNLLIKYPDTLLVTVKIKAMLPISWGTKYKCKVLEISKGELSGNDSCFLMSTAKGSEKIYKEIHSLRAGENYIIEFVKLNEDKAEPFLPVGTTGFLDKNGIIWSISKINKTAIESESTFAVLAL